MEAISAISSAICLSKLGCNILNNSDSFLASKASISIIMKRSTKARSITRVAVYSVPMLAVAINVTPLATGMVGASWCSSKRKYLCPGSNTVIKIFQASGCALLNSSNKIMASSVWMAFTNKDSQKVVPSSFLKWVLPIKVPLGSWVAPKLK